ncbi:hypothetical protein, partial [Streptococcus koreensis]|uniref:hypothetical protein n=1 Tax=Streptococcus koreensis TaxID=2382163 RepID=UPI0022E97E69
GCVPKVVATLKNSTKSWTKSQLLGKSVFKSVDHSFNDGRSNFLEEPREDSYKQLFVRKKQKS